MQTASALPYLPLDEPWLRLHKMRFLTTNFTGEILLHGAIKVGEILFGFLRNQVADSAEQASCTAV
jgi:hypothetical protein